MEERVCAGKGSVPAVIARVVIEPRIPPLAAAFGVVLASCRCAQLVFPHVQKLRTLPP